MAQDITIGSRVSITSEILKEERPLLIYLPPSYYSNKDQQYPVLYILDGDYNFQYVTGLIELQSNISENIPEMIVVGISGKGTKTYRKNCKPNIQGAKDIGNADETLQFIKSELTPYIHSNYKAADYKILAGHSIGGLFVINSALVQPDLFNHYIAISPALWWSDKAIQKRAKDIFKKNTSYSSDVYVSLADEKGMEVASFLKHTNDGFKFKQFEEENHNSVGEPTYKWALKAIFKTWKTEQPFFDSSESFITHYNKVKSHYNTTFNIPNGVLGYTHYKLKSKEAEIKKIQEFVSESYPASLPYFNTLIAANYLEYKAYEKAETLLTETLKQYPNSFEVLQKLSEVNKELNKLPEAKTHIETAIRSAKEQQARQWQINELLEAKEMLQN
ncbi:alpha/beta hydrolase-fold protein [Ulvibacter litoralis]|uniref:alpha/beta hydrolase-fold protein n=1 Tax=Ulvibacter litoralis TaxID=227084 RepID=UPI0016738699|nr:alpha/beta hydrolase-fold protein [Ulvibacter litoralis]